MNGSQSSALNSSVGRGLLPCYIGEGQAEEDKVIMKRMAIAQDEGLPREVLKETFFLKKLSSTHTRTLRDVVLTPTHVYLVLTYHGPSLQEVLSASPESLDRLMGLKIAYSLLESLEFIHSRNIAHLALSPDRVLIGPDGKARLEGFASAQMTLNSAKSRSNEFHFNAYSAPEVVNRTGELGPASDMWSFALILISILTCRPLPCLSHRSQLADFISQFFPNGQSHCSEAKLLEKVPMASNIVIDFLRKLLVFPCDQRLSAHSARSHSFFSSLSLSVPAD